MSAPEERLEMAIELCEMAESLLREKIRRTRPMLSTAEVEAEVDAWYTQRTGAEHGDADGQVVPWPRARP